MTRKPSQTGVFEAMGKLAQVLAPSPLMSLSLRGHMLSLKCESLQPVGAFKLRGAWHRLTALDDDERAAGVVAFSSGNHAQGVAWAAHKLGIAATIVMPADAPPLKISGTRSYGAEVVFYDRATQSREAIAGNLAKAGGAVLVPSFDDPWIIEGQGTAGIEAAVQMDAPPDLVIVPCGGGGLASGIALALPDARIVVVEPEGWDDMARSLYSGEIIPVAMDAPPTLCDALMTPRVSPLTFDILRDRSAHGLSVSEEEIGAAMRLAHADLGLTLEPGGAVALAAVLAGKVDCPARTLVILSGGNVDPALFVQIMNG